MFFGDAASAPTLSRAVTAGRIRRLASRVYSADLAADEAALVARNRWQIIGRIIPDAVVADRSAAQDGRPGDGTLFVVSGSWTSSR